MLAKLLSLLIHAKAGAISGVFLLGATGALVSVSASNGVTTITLTDPSPTPTATASPTPTTSPTATPTATPTASPAASPKLSSSAPTTACTDEAKAIALQVQHVNSAFSTFHTDLMKLRDVRDRTTVEKADKLLKQVRQSAVKAIHATATATCKKHDDDEDEADNDKDEDANDKDTNEKDEHADKAPSAGLTFTGDATSIATQAIAAMQTAFDTAKNAAVTTPKSNHTPEPKKNDDNKKHDGKSSEHHD